MENLNRVLLENVLPAHVAEHFLARNWKNEVGEKDLTAGGRSQKRCVKKLILPPEWRPRRVVTLVRSTSNEDPMFACGKSVLFGVHWQGNRSFKWSAKHFLKAGVRLGSLHPT